MKPAILIASPFNELYLAEAKKRYEITYIPDATKATLRERFAPFDAVVIATKPGLDASVLECGSQLKLIIRLGIGIDHVDLQFCHAHNINVAITPNANIAPVIELVFSQLIRILRHFSEAEAALYKGTFRNKLTLGGELKNRTLGVIGTGRIGSQICKVAAVFGMHVIAYDPYADHSGIPAHFVNTLSNLLTQSDIVTLHVPLTEETDKMVNEQFIEEMKANSILINASRGKVAPMQTLINAAKLGKIAHFIIDVYDEEPFIPLTSDHELLKKYFTLTPHIGAYTEESLLNRSKECLEELDEYFYKDQIPHGKIDLLKGY